MHLGCKKGASGGHHTPVRAKHRCPGEASSAVLVVMLCWGGGVGVAEPQADRSKILDVLVPRPLIHHLARDANDLYAANT